ncbi:hypothetical protein AAFF_G00413370 [Aldrovandia affinis]|uniref:Uncharacterized protein n=1 Tax=Aldrovandia affinis TaxID=143900 RepID=A0AAD7WKF5_9TELE|nr:hypothetical protein AAFF_G00413370 [Aldrovandia affinis]
MTAEPGAVWTGATAQTPSRRDRRSVTHGAAAQREQHHTPRPERHRPPTYIQRSPPTPSLPLFSPLPDDDSLTRHRLGRRTPIGPSFPRGRPTLPPARGGDCETTTAAKATSCVTTSPNLDLEAKGLGEGENL